MEIEHYLVRPDDRIRDVMQVINANKDGIALVVDNQGKLVGTVTDGDIRRLLLSGRTLEGVCTDVMHEKPVMAEASADRNLLLELIRRHRIRNVPVVDQDRRPVRIVSFNELINGRIDRCVAVVMAGGEGTRLRPLTENLPKPMIKVGGVPVLEQLVDNLKRCGITDLFLSVNYRGEIIESYFGDGAAFGVNIRYLKEEMKMGTAGSLSLLRRQRDLPKTPLLVLNGDVVTDVNFRHFIEFHRQHRSVMSMAAIEYKLKIPYGVLNIAGHHVLGLEEKPTERFLCNAGIYTIESDIVHLVPDDTYYDMTDLLRDVVGRGLPVSAFPIHEQWVDIGRKEDLDRLKRHYENSKKIESGEE